MIDSPRDYKASDIQNIFNTIAPVYDRLNNDLSFGLHWVWKQMVVDWTDPSPGSTYLDLCCGSGDISQLLAKKLGRNGQVYGVDFAKSQLENAANRANQVYLPSSIKWVEGDALDLPFEDDFFHGITMGYGLRNVVDIPRCLSEIYRVLRVGGKAGILDFHQPKNPLVRSFQQWYLSNIVIPSAKGLNMTSEYGYIIPSLEKFPSGDRQVELGIKAGFNKAHHYLIAGGIMGILVLEK